ncbi:type VI secretion system Vgr family protein, partial [Arhodomonas aquaeolei]|uniref:type VI secretion system Vgr family protein n=1 Tax=Arhodomonas aquaeolei TaxID=2369 RepID=UPI000374209B
MTDITFMDTLLERFEVSLTQHQRLLRLELGAAAGLLPHRLVGEEAVSTPFRYRLDCLCQRGDLELKHLIGAPARLAIRQADGSERPLHALVAEAARLGEDGGLSTYQLTLVPWLSMLALGRGSRIFQDRSVPGIATAVFDAHALARGRYRFELRRDYPARSYCVQYRESDLHFISRLFEEEGLFYYFVHGGEAGHTLVVTDDVDTCPAVEPATIRFHRQGPTETRDTLTQWGGRRRAQPTRVSLATFDYKQPSLARRTVLDTAHERGNAPAAEHYDYAGTYYYRGFERGGRLAANRLEAFDARARRFHGAGGARQLLAGHRFELTEHPLHDTGGEAERHFLVLALSVHAENALPVSPALHALPGSLQPDIDAARRAHGLEAHGDEREDYRSAGTGHYLVSLEAQRAHIPYRPALEHPRPVLAGPQTATVVGPEGEEIHTDHLNRVKVRFHWDRLARGDERDSCWLRVAEPSAGAGWGAVFTPRVGQEVLVDFLDADPDRPLITARVFNAATPPPWHSNGLLSGLRSRAYRASGHNELVFDDATGQQRLRLASDHAASQLNLG